MNRLSPLITRRAGTAAAAVAADYSFDEMEPAGALADLKLFASIWLGGFVFFGTFFG